MTVFHSELNNVLKGHKHETKILSHTFSIQLFLRIKNSKQTFLFVDLLWWQKHYTMPPTCSLDSNKTVVLWQRRKIESESRP